MIVAGALAVLLVIGLGLAAVLAGSGSTGSRPTAPSTAATGPLVLAPVDAPAADSAGCVALMAHLPAALTNTGAPLPRRPIAPPVPPATVAWSSPTGDAVVSRCGVAPPTELTATSELLDVSGVRWLRVAGDRAATWYAVDRPVYVALTLPGDVGTGPIQDVSNAIAATLPAQPVRPAGG